ncbi:MAG TPA: multicopper oxidase domain-containing protein [Rhodanobacter sp.]|nr:multicopper oxidase domain-containing protein [Rhodanobacter sp.]
MSEESGHEVSPRTLPAMARTALRVAFGLIWVVNAALTWTNEFAVHYVGYLHNAAQGQSAWSGWWFSLWIAVVTPHAMLFVWATRIIETALALALVFGFARKTTYIAGALFSLLVWSTAEGFGGPYAVGATNMGAGIVYVLVFIALLVINSRSGPSPYSLDFYIEKRCSGWRKFSELSGASQPRPAQPVSWGVQAPILIGIAVLVFFLVAGLHSSLNVKGASPTAAAAAVSPLSLASSEPVKHPRDARLPPLTDGPSVNVDISSTDGKVEIASGVQYQAWTFGAMVPGPTVHVRQGQTVNVTYTNHGTMQHSIDFHSALTPPNLSFAEVDPGKSITFSFVAKVPGAFVYHCGTQPVLLHMANGMYGAIIVDPATPLPPAAESYVIVQGEWYTQQVAGNLMGANYQKMLDERPDEVVFNGIAFQYRDHPLPVTPGKRVRIYFVNAGPSLWSSFHVIGEIFDAVYPDGDMTHALTGVSTYSVGPGAGAIFDLVIQAPGKYPFVDHSMAHMTIGAQGILAVGTPSEIAAKVPAITSAATPAPNAAPAASTPVAAAATGPYKFDPAKGSAIYTANCAACHQATGTGLPGAFPPLKDNPVVNDPDPAKQITTILHGLQGENVMGTVYPSAMPPFAASLSDADIADVANHERTSWGNQGKQVTAAQVQALRAKGGGK